MPIAETGGLPEALSRLLLAPQERVGWEYAPPDPITAHPDLHRQPQWVAPPSSDVSALEQKKSQQMRRLPVRILIVFMFFLLSTSVSASLGLIFALALSAFWFGPLIATKVRIGEIESAAKASLERSRAQHREALQRWEESVRSHDAAERQRVDSALHWFPVLLPSDSRRLDVFGGTVDGWGQLLVTLGSGILASGSGILLADFTEQEVGRGLADLADRHGHGVRHLALPAQLTEAGLLENLDAEDVGEVLAEAIHSMRQSESGEHVDLRGLGADVIRGVADGLEGRVTFARLSAGFRVLQRVYDVEEAGVLSAEEVRKLSAYADALGQTQRVQNEVSFLGSAVDLLARQDRDGYGVEPTSLWPAGGVTVLATSSPSERRKDFTDRVVFHVLLHQLRTNSVRSRPPVLVIAGGDHIGRAGLESLARQARRTGVRLIYLLHHLRGDLQQILGDPDSTALLMRQGNAREAAAAAEFIGRGHKFALSQLTMQIGDTRTQGGGRSVGVTNSVAETEGTSHSVGIRWDSAGRSSSQSTTWSTAHSVQDSTNWSEAESLTQGETQARVYEFEVEPTTIQRLPETAFILVNPGGQGRRALLGDCNPRLVGVDKLATSPRPT